MSLVSAAEVISNHPHIGRVVPEFGDELLRERIHRSYRIIYQVRPQQRSILIVRFWHSARGTPNLEGEA